ncbi:Nuclear transcription factor Y subunit B-4 [Dorcoceras hygrometricum]|nr:Nuclear transcription factor Y subunit B-4 [Dorcoceras hygrometricum]
MKQILPPNAKITKEAKQTMQECASEFISFVTSEASEKCHRENRKTTNGDDICWALCSLGFDRYSEGMSRYLARFRKSAASIDTQSEDGRTGGNKLAQPLIFDFGILQKGTNTSPKQTKF